MQNILHRFFQFVARVTLLRTITFTMFVLAAALSSNWFNWRGEAAKPNCASLAFDTVALPVGTVNQPYSATVESDGGVAPYTFTLQSGTLPNGLTFNNGTFSGTPVQPANATLQIQTQDANGCTGTQDFTLQINCQTIIVTAPANNTGLLNAPFSAQFTQSGGIGTTVFSTTSPLPTGITLVGNGGLSGTTTQLGSFPLVVKATDGNGCTGTVNYTLTIACQTLTISPATLPAATRGVTFSQTLTAANAFGATGFAVTSGTLPNGLTLTGNGLLTGTPGAVGNFSFTIQATDAQGCTGTQGYSMNILCPAITLAPGTLPDGQAGTAYSASFSATPAGGAYTFALTSGLLPPGITLQPGGSLSGTPTATGVFNFRVTATGFGGQCSGFRDYQILISGCAPITLNPASLPNGTVGANYGATISPLPGGVYQFAVANGALPAGLMLNGASGAITGSPTMPGTFSFRISASTGSGGGACSGFRDYTVTINCPAITLSASLPNGSVGANYNQTISVTPAGTYGFSLVSGSLPSGLALNASLGVISGMPLATGTFNFTIKVQAANGCSGTQQLSLAINCPAIALSSLATPTLGTAYNQTVTVAPTGGNYSFAVSSVALPTGLSLNAATGALTGTPTAAGTFNFTILATGFGACTGSRAYSFTLGGGGCPAITLPDLPNGTVGQPYSNSISANPASTYSYAVTSGSLPPGLTLFGAVGLLFGHLTVAGSYSFTITATDSNNCAGSKSYSVTIGGAGSGRAVFGDFDGDGKADLSVWRGKQSDWLIVRSSDGKLQTAQWGADYDPYNDVIVQGDYDGDGKMDLAVVRRGIQKGQGQKGQGGEWLINRSRDGSVMAEAWGLASDTPVPADYDGDGKTDIAVWRGADTNWYIQRSSDHQTQIVSWGTSNAPYRDVPVPADYDGDGKTDIAVFRQSNGHWYIRQSSDGQVIDRHWGLGTDVPVVADYDGDGKADIAVWCGADTNWYIVRSSDGQTEIVSWGASWLGDMPVPGDYDGDGKADVAVWRATEGNWYIKLSRDDSVITKAHGQAGDVPVAAKLR